MQIDLTLKNYRCFPDSNPARLALRKGFTALLGPNNCGKSSLLKFFFEFRDLFDRLSSPNDAFLLTLRGAESRRFNLVGTSDIAEVFSNENTRNLQVEIDCAPSPGEAVNEAVPTRLVVEVLRGQNTFSTKELQTARGTISRHAEHSFSHTDNGFHLVRGGTRVAYMQPFFDALRPL